MEELIAYAAEKILNVPKQDIEYVIHSGGGGEHGFVTILFYSNSRPALVARISRRDCQRLRTEHNNLVWLSRLLDKTELSKTVEKPYALTNLAGFDVLLKEVKTGTPGTLYLSRGLCRRRNRAQTFLSLTVRWITDFAAASAEHHINSYDAKKQAVYLLTGLHDPAYSEAVCRNNHIFLSPCHGDLVATNVLVNTHEDYINVIDFENFTMLGFCAIDLISIIVSIGTSLFGFSEEMVSKTFYTSNIAILTTMLPLYSDRAIFLCKKWQMTELLHFHEKLKWHFENQKASIIWQY